MIPELSPITHEARRRLSRILFGFFLFFALAIAVQLIAAVAVNVFAPQLLELPIFTWLVSLFPMYGIGLPVLYLAVRDLPAASPKGRRLRVRDFLTFLLISYAVMYLANLVSVGVNLISSLIFGASSNAGATELISTAPLGYTILFAVIIGPIVEEVIFRHIILRRLLPFGEGFAVGISSLLFGLYHGNLAQFLYAFAVGWIFAIVAVRTGKLIHTILLHVFINFLGSVPASLLMPYIETYLSGEEIEMTGEAVTAILITLAYSGIVLLLVGAGILLLILRRRAFVPHRGEASIPRGERRYLPLSLGGALYLVAILALFALSYL